MIWAWISLAILIAFIAVIYLLFPLLSPSPIELKNAHVVITGGSSGIGKALAEEAVKRGSKVTLIARDKKKLDEAKSAVLSSSPEMTGKEVVNTVSVDLCGGFDQVDNAISEAEACLGPVDFLVNCAGSAFPGRFDEVPISDFKKMMDLNYLSAVQTTRAVIPGMKARGRGRVVFVSSQAGQLGMYGYTAYSASKFALRGLAESLQMEMKPYNIYVTLSFPPDTDTPGFKEENKSKPKETALISETSSLTSPVVVAQTILKDAKKGQFLSSVGMEGLMLSTLTSGFSPVSSIMEAVQQVMLVGVFRLVALCVLYSFNKIVQDCKVQQEKNASTESKKLS